MLLSTFRLLFFNVICVFCRLVVLVGLSVPVQVIDWKDYSEMTYKVLMGTLNPTQSFRYVHTFGLCLTGLLFHGLLGEIPGHASALDR